MLVYSKIKDLRLENNRSQEEIANVLGISRPTYSGLELGRQELSIDHLEKLSKFYSIDLASLLMGTEPNIEKYAHMLLYFLRVAKTKDGKIPKTKLAKLLYLADFTWYYNKLESMSGLPYRKIPYGPVSDTYFRVVEELLENGRLELEKKEFDEGKVSFLIFENKSNSNQRLDQLSEEEKELIKKIALKWSDKSTNEIVNFTHNQMPYFLCREGEIIPYELITQEDKEKLY
jgi:transcriptional regulator with XRE-family HTH domain